jgi:hypothetical protein
MPSKKSNNNKVLISNSDNESCSSDDNSTKLKKKLQSKPIENESDDELSDDEIVETKQNKNAASNSQFKSKISDDESEDVDNVPGSESESESESDSDENQNKKSKEKKSKESFDEILKKLDFYQSNIKVIDKEISEATKIIKGKEKTRNDYERQRNSILKLLSKTHNDEVIKARKEKPKRKGNINGGFCKEQPVPEILIKFLDLKDGDVCLKRPQVMSKLSNKFSTMGLKKGQDTTLSKEVVKELELDKSYINKVIKFGEFQTFLKGFYPVKEEKNIVSVA